MSGDQISKAQEHYYDGLLKEHGYSIDAVASAKQAYKYLRYTELSKVFLRDEAASVHDIGFGLGHYLEFIRSRFPEKRIEYSGSEITASFVEHCTSAYPDCKFHLRDLAEGPLPERYDYLVFGGTFYHLAGSEPAEFRAWTERMLRYAFASCNRGISFNFVTGYCEYRTDDLFYGELEEVVPFVVNNLSRYFDVSHGTPLYEYTVQVYTEEYIRTLYPQDEFQKYYK